MSLDEETRQESSVLNSGAKQNYRISDKTIFQKLKQELDGKDVIDTETGNQYQIEYDRVEDSLNFYDIHGNVERFGYNKWGDFKIVEWQY